MRTRAYPTWRSLTSSRRSWTPVEVNRPGLFPRDRSGQSTQPLASPQAQAPRLLILCGLLFTFIIERNAKFQKMASPNLSHRGSCSPLSPLPTVWPVGKSLGLRMPGCWSCLAPLDCLEQTSPTHVVSLVTGLDGLCLASRSGHRSEVPMPGEAQGWPWAQKARGPLTQK